MKVATLVLKFKKSYFSLLLLPLVHLVLLELFASTLYPLYFLTLLFTIYVFNLKKLFLSLNALMFLLIYAMSLYSVIRFFEDALYDLYIDVDMTFELSYLSYEVCCLLSAIHIFILFLLGYNRDKLI